MAAVVHRELNTGSNAGKGVSNRKSTMQNFDILRVVTRVLDEN